MVITFEWFKEKFRVLSNSLAVDNSDPLSDLNILHDLFSHFKSGFCSPEDERYMFCTMLPRVVSILLKRKFQVDKDAHISGSKSILSSCASAIGLKLETYPEALCPVLAELFDHTQHFYTRYGRPKFDPVYITGNRKVSEAKDVRDVMFDEEWIRDCASGNYVDLYSEERKLWEPAVIENISATRTEIEVLCEYDNTKQWFSLDDPRLAKFGVRSCMKDGGSPPVVPVAQKMEVEGTTTNHNVNHTWVLSLEIGTVVDALTRSNHWVEACILDKYVSVNSNNAMDSSKSDDKITGVKRPRERDISSNSGDVIDLTEDGEKESNVQISDISRTFVLISFIGCPERADEWFDLSDHETVGRIAPAGTYSGGRHEDYSNPIRPEVVHLMKLQVVQPEVEMCCYALQRLGGVLPLSYIEVVESFGVSDGFKAVGRILNRLGLDTEGENAHRNMSWVHMYLDLILALCRPAYCYSYTLLKSLPGGKLGLCCKFLCSLTPLELREVPNEKIESVLYGIDSLSYMCAKAGFCDLRTHGECVELLWLQLCINYLSTAYLSKRLFGVKLLLELVTRSNESKEFPNGFKVIRTVTSSANSENIVCGNNSERYNLSFKPVPVTYFLDLKSIQDRLCEHNTYYDMFCGDSAHSSIMQRIKPALIIFCSDGNVSESLLNLIWASGTTYQFDDAISLLIDIIPYLKLVSEVNGISATFALEWVGGMVGRMESLPVAVLSERILDLCIVIYKSVSTLLLDLKCKSIAFSIPLENILNSIVQFLWKLYRLPCPVKQVTAILTDDHFEITHYEQTNTISGRATSSGSKMVSVFSAKVRDSILLKLEEVLKATSRCIKSNDDSKVKEVDKEVNNDQMLIYRSELHWDVCKNLLRLTVSDLLSAESVVTSLEIIKLVINSFPHQPIDTEKNLNCRYPMYRYSVIDFIQYELSVDNNAKGIDLIGVVITFLLSLKANLNLRNNVNSADALAILKNVSICGTRNLNYAEFKPLSDSVYQNNVSQMCVDSVIYTISDSQVKGFGSCISYGVTLQTCLHFIQSYILNSSNLELSMQNIRALWESFVFGGICETEFIYIFDFLAKFVVLSKANKASVTNHRTTITSDNNIVEVFEKLLYDLKFIRCALFEDKLENDSVSNSSDILCPGNSSQSTLVVLSEGEKYVDRIADSYLSCLGRLFYYMNYRKGHVLLVSKSGQSPGSKKSSITSVPSGSYSIEAIIRDLSINTNPNNLSYLQCFFDIVTNSPNSVLSKKAIWVCSQLPLRVSKSQLGSSDSNVAIVEYTTNLLDRCLRELQSCYDDMQSSNPMDVDKVLCIPPYMRLKRYLLMIEQLITSSSSRPTAFVMSTAENVFTDLIVRGHQRNIRGNRVLFKVNGGNNKALVKYLSFGQEHRVKSNYYDMKFENELEEQKTLLLSCFETDTMEEVLKTISSFIYDGISLENSNSDCKDDLGLKFFFKGKEMLLSNTIVMKKTLKSFDVQVYSGKEKNVSEIPFETIMVYMKPLKSSEVSSPVGPIGPVNMSMLCNDIAKRGNNADGSNQVESEIIANSDRSNSGQVCFPLDYGIEKEIIAQNFLANIPSVLLACNLQNMVLLFELLHILERPNAAYCGSSVGPIIASLWKILYYIPTSPEIVHVCITNKVSNIFEETPVAFSIYQREIFEILYESLFLSDKEMSDLGNTNLLRCAVLQNSPDLYSGRSLAADNLLHFLYAQKCLQGFVKKDGAFNIYEDIFAWRARELHRLSIPERESKPNLNWTGIPYKPTLCSVDLIIAFSSICNNFLNCSYSHSFVALLNLVSKQLNRILRCEFEGVRAIADSSESFESVLFCKFHVNAMNISNNNIRTLADSESNAKNNHAFNCSCVNECFNNATKILSWIWENVNDASSALIMRDLDAQTGEAGYSMIQEILTNVLSIWCGANFLANIWFPASSFANERTESFKSLLLRVVNVQIKANVGDELSNRYEKIVNWYLYAIDNMVNIGTVADWIPDDLFAERTQYLPLRRTAVEELLSLRDSFGKFGTLYDLIHKIICNSVVCTYKGNDSMVSVSPKSVLFRNEIDEMVFNLYKEIKQNCLNPKWNSKELVGILKLMSILIELFGSVQISDCLLGDIDEFVGIFYYKLLNLDSASYNDDIILTDDGVQAVYAILNNVCYLDGISKSANNLSKGKSLAALLLEKLGYLHWKVLKPFNPSFIRDNNVKVEDTTLFRGSAVSDDTPTIQFDFNPEFNMRSDCIQYQANDSSGLDTSSVVNRTKDLRGFSNSSKVVVNENAIKAALSGYSGLRNMGSTCYMSSLLQALFMTPTFRNLVLCLEVPTELMFTSGLLSPDKNISAVFDKDRAISLLQGNLLIQLKYLFLHLQYSNLKAYYPVDWMHAFKDETMTEGVNVKQQQDAQEFFQVFCDRLDESFRELKQIYELCNYDIGKLSNILSLQSLTGFVFGGRLYHQFRNQSISDSSRTGVREHFEDFVSLSVDVKGCPNGLEESLKKFVSEETISDFQWEQGQPRVSIAKMQCLMDSNAGQQPGSMLPKHLICHLKRFDINFDTFLREKVNDHFPFPLELKVNPFSKSELVESNYNISPMIYELYGIVIHTGYTDSGHYYSILRDVKDSKFVDPSRWIIFNDSNVKLFREEDIASECFGRKSAGEDSTKSAYMLLYKSKDYAGEEYCNCNFDEFTEFVKNRIIADNLQISQQWRVYGVQHLNFLEQFLKSVQRGIPEIHSEMSVNELFAKGLEYSGYVSDIYERYLYALLYILAPSAHKNYLKNVALNMYDIVTVDINFFSAVQTMYSHALNSTQRDIATPQNQGMLSFMYSTAEQLFQGNQAPTKEISKDHAAFVQINTGNSGLSVLTKYSRVFVQSLTAWDSVVRGCVALVAARMFELALNQAGSEDIEMLRRIVTSDENLPSSTISTCKLDKLSTAPDSIGNAKVVTSQAAAVINTQSKPDYLNNFDIGSEDAELAAAIAMSMDVSQPEAPVKKDESPDENAIQRVPGVDIIDDYHCRCPIAHFLFILTKDSFLREMLGNWRKSEHYQWLIYQIVSLCAVKCPQANKNEIRSLVLRYLVKRELIAQIIDAILGDSSQLCGELYAKGSRTPRAVSSYISVPPFTPEIISRSAPVIRYDIDPLLPIGSLIQTPSSVRNIPDWTSILNALYILVCQCNVSNMIHSIDSSNAPTTNSYFSNSWTTPGNKPEKSLFSMDREYSGKLLYSRTFHTTLLKQYRYSSTPLFHQMIGTLLLDNISFSSMYAEVLCETIGMATFDGLAHLFGIIDLFVSIKDSFTMNRINLLLGNNRYPTCLFEVFKARAGDASQQKFVLVGIRSLLQIINQNPSVANILASSVQEQTRMTLNNNRPNNPLTLSSDTTFIAVDSWASWMLKFCYLYKLKCLETAVENSTNEPKKGPYVVVFGDSMNIDCANVKITCTKDEIAASNAAHEILWNNRVFETYDLLNTTLIALNFEPDALIPADSFVTDEIRSESKPLEAKPLSTFVTDSMFVPVEHGPLPPPAPSVSIDKGIGTSDGSSIDMMNGLSDNMTDEELALYLSQYE